MGSSNGFWALFSRDRLPACPFCTGPEEGEGMEESRQILGAWYCRQCDTTFKLSKGELEPVYEFDPGAELVRRRTCIPLTDPTSTGNVLCRTCLHNQTIQLQLLSAFDPSSSSDDGTFERMARQYQRDLERRYPLCAPCKYVVDQKLSALTLKLKSRNIGKSLGQSKMARIQSIEQKNGKPPVQFHLYMALILSCLVDGVLHTPREYIASWKHYPYLLILERLFLSQKNIAVLLGILGLVDFFNTISPSSFVLCSVLTALRIAHHLSLIPEKYGVVVKVLLVALHLAMLLSSRKRRTILNRSDSSLPMTDIEPLQATASPSPSKAIVNELMDVDWGLGTAIPTSTKSTFGTAISSNISISNNISTSNNRSTFGTPRPFAPPFSASQPASDRKSFFAPSRLDPAKAVASMFNTPVRKDFVASAFTSGLQPSRLSVERPSGLEGAFGGFSFSETPPESPLESSVSAVHEIGLTCLFIALRILVKDKLLFIAMILAGSFAVRRYVWNQLPSQVRYGFMGLAGFRFAFLAAQLTEPDFYSLTVGPLWIRLANLLLDLAILAVR